MGVECTHCHCEMSRAQAADGNAYYSCPRCLRTFASIYDEVFRKGAGARPVQSAAAPRPKDEKFDAVKSRLDAFLRRLDESDPWYVLGIRPGASFEEIRTRYRELALVHHPDRGGDARDMRRLNRAYETLRMRATFAEPCETVPARAAASSAMAARPNRSR